MIRSIRASALLWIACLVEQLMLLPVLLLLYIYLVPEETQALWLAGLPLLALAGIALRRRVHAVWTHWISATAIGIAYAYATAGANGYGIPALIVGFAAVYQGITVPERMWNTRLYWAGIAVYFIGGILFGKLPALAGMLQVIAAGAVICIAVTLFASNALFLREASFAGNKNRFIPAVLRSHNRIYVASLLALALIVTGVSGSLIGTTLFQALKAVLHWLFNGRKAADQPVETPPESPPIQMLPEDQTGEPGLLSRIMDILMYSISALLVAAALGYLMYWLYKNGGEIWRRWISRVLKLLLRQTNRSEDGAGYEDEETNLFSWETMKVQVRNRWLERLGRRDDRWEHMRSNSERARYLYRKWLRMFQDKGYEPQKHMTPSETGEDAGNWTHTLPRQLQERLQAGTKAAVSLIALYNKARYSGKDIGDEEVEQVRRRL